MILEIWINRINSWIKRIKIYDTSIDTFMQLNTSLTFTLAFMGKKRSFAIFRWMIFFKRLFLHWIVKMFISKLMHWQLLVLCCLTIDRKISFKKSAIVFIKCQEPISCPSTDHMRILSLWGNRYSLVSSSKGNRRIKIKKIRVV